MTALNSRLVHAVKRRRVQSRVQGSASREHVLSLKSHRRLSFDINTKVERVGEFEWCRLNEVEIVSRHANLHILSGYINRNCEKFEVPGCGGEMLAERLRSRFVLAANWGQFSHYRVAMFLDLTPPLR